MEYNPLKSSSNVREVIILSREIEKCLHNERSFYLESVSVSIEKNLKEKFLRYETYLCLCAVVRGSKFSRD